MRSVSFFSPLFCSFIIIVPLDTFCVLCMYSASGKSASDCRVWQTDAKSDWLTDQRRKTVIANKTNSDPLFSCWIDLHYYFIPCFVRWCWNKYDTRGRRVMHELDFGPLCLLNPYWLRWETDIMSERLTRKESKISRHNCNKIIRFWCQRIETCSLRLQSIISWGQDERGTASDDADVA